MAKLEILKPGLYTNIQDLGRYGYESYGVPCSGAMDQKSARLANLLVNNPESAPIIEITLHGPEIYFDSDTLIAITGAQVDVICDQHTLDPNKPHLIAAGNTVSFGAMIQGARTYLGIQGMQSKRVMNSYSQYQGITKNKKLATGDKINYETARNYSSTHTSVAIPSSFNKSLNVYEGPEFHLIPERAQNQLIDWDLTIGSNDRMGYQISSFSFSHDHELLSQPVRPGTIQWTPSGYLYVLMRDAQVTGGYPRILQLTEDSIDQLAQMRTGESIRLSLMPY